MIKKGTDILTENIKRILVIQLGDIGDVVWSTPTLWAIKSKFPQAQLSILVHAGFGCLIKNDPSLHKVFEVQSKGKNLFQQITRPLDLIRDLRHERFDVAIDLRSSDRGAITAFLSGSPLRIAKFYRADVPFWRNYLFTHLTDPSPSDRLPGAADQSLSVVREFGMQAGSTVPKLWVSQKDVKRVEGMLQEIMGPEFSSWISLNPFSRWAYKEWKIERWLEVIDWIHSEFQLPCVIIGSPGEREAAENIKKECGSPVFNLAGRTSLGELAALLSLSKLHIGVDSAAPHIAAAVGAATATIYGPSDWKEWAPPGERHRVIIPEQECAPCRQKGCQGSERSRCLDELQPGRVKEIIKEALKNELGPGA